MEILLAFIGTQAGLLSLFIGFMFIFGYTWIAKTDDVDYVDDDHINDLQDLKVDTDGETPMVGTFQEDKGANVTAATNMTLGSDGNYYVITGNTAIVSIIHAQAQPGTVIRLKFSGTPVITHSATDLILPGGANLTMAAGNVMELVNIDTSKWRCTNILKADGTPVVGTPNAVLKDGTVAMTGTFQEDKGADVISGATLALGSDGNYYVITGSGGPITSITHAQAQPGTMVRLKFSSTPVITHSATDLILPGGANITAAANDVMTLVNIDTDKWRCSAYTKASGEAVVGGAASLRTSETKTANYVLVAGDVGKTIEMDNAAARTFTFPALSTLGKGWWVTLVKEGAGDVSLIPNGAEEIGRFGNNTVKNEQAAEAGWANITVMVAYDETKLVAIGADGSWNT